nr:TBC1 domain family member 15 [Leptinotarsa decemlineata]
MEDNVEDQLEIFCQDGVLLKQAPATHICFLNSIGTLCLSESPNSSRKRYIEWKPNDVTIDSDIQDQEWTLVNTVRKRNRTLSGNYPPDFHSRIRSIKFSFQDVKSFRVSNKNRQMTFYDGQSEVLCVFGFQHGNCEGLLIRLKALFKTSVSRRDKQLHIIYDATHPEFAKIEKSFAELNIQSDPYTLWSVLKNIKDNPYEATFEAFAKFSDYVYRHPGQREIENVQPQALSRSPSHSIQTTTHSQGDYEVINKVPERKDFPRLRPLTQEQWSGHLNHEGMIEDVESVKNLIFRGGITPSLRKEVWKFLLEYYPWSSTEAERQKLVVAKSNEYYIMKLQWKRMTKVQEENFSDYRERKNLIEKDVNRTDRNVDFYAGDDNANLQTLNDILMTYLMYNFDLGYVQGMSDLLSPILQLLEDEVESFWCFVGFMNIMSRNFDIDQAGMKDQLNNLRTLLAFVQPQLVSYMDAHESGNMFFCFRWLLVWYKRELSQEDVMRLWEVMWTGYPCENFHLLIGVAILESQKRQIMENNCGFNEILKHINDLCGKIDMAVMLNKAEGIYHEIKEAEHLTDHIRSILGLPIPLIQSSSSRGSHEPSPFEEAIAEEGSNAEEQPGSSSEKITIAPDEILYEKSLSANFL